MLHFGWNQWLYDMGFFVDLHNLIMGINEKLMNQLDLQIWQNVNAWKHFYYLLGVFA